MQALMQYQEVQKKLLKLKNLKQKIDQDESELKLEYLMLTRERNVYFEKLKQIQLLAEQSGWQDESGIFEAIQNLLNNLGESRG